MANIKSAKKRVVTNERDSAQVKSLLPEALSEIDRAASKGVIHPNSASRKKSMLQRRANSL
ncbi:MAG: 30S ribosomal protein S20 [Candidatus Hydrogenedentes bacterium]|nr:30S ribosomal protein S20 [Candidatus Hydrogenedentota bacterium]